MGSSYTTRLAVEPIDGKNWRLVLPFTYHIGSKRAKRYIRVPANFITDFASIPWFLWRLLFWFLPYWSKYNKAPVLHDWLYKVHILTRAEADLVFYEAMLVSFRDHRSGRVVAWLEYKAVRLFGGWAYTYKGAPKVAHHTRYITPTVPPEDKRPSIGCKF